MAHLIGLRSKVRERRTETKKLLNDLNLMGSLPGWGCRSVLVTLLWCCNRVVGKQPSICCSKFQFEFCGLINASLEFVFIYLSRVMDMVIKTLADTAMWQTMSLQGPVKSKFYFLTMKKKTRFGRENIHCCPFSDKEMFENRLNSSLFLPKML